MIDKNLKMTFLLNASGNSCCFNLDEYFFPE